MIPLILADASLTVPLEAVLWIAGLTCTVVGALLMIIYNSMKHKIAENNSFCIAVQKDAKDRCEALEKKHHTDLGIIFGRIDQERIERTSKHDDLATRFGGELDKTKEKVNDLSETVAGIGSVYITRNEFTQHQMLNHGPRRKAGG